MKDNFNKKTDGADERIVPRRAQTPDTVESAEQENESPVKKAKKKSLFAMQKRAIAILLVMSVLLGAGAFVVNKFVSRHAFVDEKGDGEKYYIVQKGDVFVLTDKSGELLPKTEDGKYYVTGAGNVVKLNANTGAASYFAYVDTEGTESASSTNNLLIFPHLSRDKIDLIEVHNEIGEFTLVRDDKTSGQTTNFMIRGYAELPVDSNMLSWIVSACGNTVTKMKLDNGKVKEYGFAEYGLEDSQVKTWYKITDTSGNTHRIMIGNMTPALDGYYVRYLGRDCVYILPTGDSLAATGMFDTSEYQSPIFAPIEDFVTPVLTKAMKVGNYFDVHNFIYWNDPTPYSDPFSVRPAATFDYMDLEERNATEFQYVPYYTFGEYTTTDMFGNKVKHDVTPKIGSYYVNEYSVDSLLYSLYSLPSATEGVKVVSLTANAEARAKYGLDNPHYRMRYTFGGDTLEILFSAKTENDTYYAKSAVYDIILEIDASYFRYFDYKDVKWLSYDFIQFNIAFCKEVEVIAKDVHYTFACDNSGSKVDSEKINSDGLIVKLKDTGALVDTDQFRNFFMTLLLTKVEGESDITDEQANELLANENKLMLTLKYKTKHRDVTIKFYRYSERRAYITINGVGGLYILVPQVEKVISDAQKVLTGEPINSESKN